SICETMYQKGEMNYAENSRYFVLTEEKSKAQKSNASKSSDTKSELKKYKEMLDEGLIDEADYNAKKKELLGL
ncbi:MAG: SHOCT domain-containing protein, partial [Porticoccaceae bacterium]|nr:SHOCT domain-containing protein [Porticoccaceae bacterium]